MGRPIMQEDIEFIKTLNFNNIMTFYKYTFIVISIGYINYLYFQLNHVS